jgi:excisionase family DNA binding protein
MMRDISIQREEFEALLREVIEPLQSQIANLQEETRQLRLMLRRPDRVKYTVLEAAERLGLSRSKVFELLKTQELQSVKESGRRLITEEMIERWEREQRR